MLKPKYKNLSNAMRAGIKMRPRKAIGDFVRGKKFACAIGCVGAVYGLDLDVNGQYEKLIVIYPILDKRVSDPVTDYAHSLGSVIVDLNDDHGWSREDIAKWIEKIEKEK